MSVIDFVNTPDYSIEHPCRDCLQRNIMSRETEESVSIKSSEKFKSEQAEAVSIDFTKHI